MNPYYTREGITIYHRDCREYLDSIPDNSFDGVIVDPPYPKACQHLYGDIASRLPRVLVRGGSYVAIVPHYGLPTILNSVGKFMKYRWIISMWQAEGAHPRMAMGIEVMWKPIVWWVNEVWPQGRGFVRDGFENDPIKKGAHKWEQSLSWAVNCLKYVPGKRVLDPLLGAGTTLIACIENGYSGVGVELEEEYCELAAKRADIALDKLEEV